MNSNPIRSALDLIDAEPSTEFLSALRAQVVGDRVLVSDDTLSRSIAPQPVEEYVAIAPTAARGTSNRRLRLVLGAAAAIAVAAIAVIVINRPNDSAESADVDPREALPLANAAMFTADQLGRGQSGAWKQVNDFSVADYEKQFAAINAKTPSCAELASVGLTLPTTKSVLAHQDFADGPVPMLHDVWVFATAHDASRAMDAIAGDVFPTCWLALFDGLTLLNRNITATSISTLWTQDPPAVAAHGDRQIVFGQKISYTFVEGGADAGAINAFVQVGRAIAFIDPQYLGSVGPGSHVETVITTSTDALEKVFGQ